MRKWIEKGGLRKEQKPTKGGTDLSQTDAIPTFSIRGGLYRKGGKQGRENEKRKEKGGGWAGGKRYNKGITISKCEGIGGANRLKGRGWEGADKAHPIGEHSPGVAIREEKVIRTSKGRGKSFKTCEGKWGG